MPSSLLIATTNQSKAKEIALGLQPLVEKGVTLLTLHDVSVKEEPEENGKTFAENAKIKAQFYGQKTDLPTIADDGGLVIDALNGEPGVKSRRWLGREATDQELIDHTLSRLAGVPKEKRTARLETVMCFYHPEKNITICEQESIDGWIAEKASGRIIPKFPYRSLLMVNEFHKYYDELTEEEHDRINHRRRLLKRFSPTITRYLIE